MRGNRQKLRGRFSESEDKYFSIFNYSFDGILLTAPDGRIFAANPAACNMFGRSEEEICRLGRSGIMNMNDPRLADAVRERERTGQFGGELTGRRKNGAIFPIELTTSVFTDSSGENRTSMIIRDISGRKRHQEELEANEANIRSIIENTDDSILSIDKDFRFIDGNSAFRSRFQKLTGHQISPGDSILDWLPEEKRKEWIGYFARGLSGENFTFTDSFVKSPEPKYFNFSFNPVRNKSGAVTGLTIMGNNVTGLIKMQQELRQSKEMLEEAQSLAKLGNWEYDVKLDKPIWSDEMFRIFGLPKEEGAPSWNDHRKRIHPDNWEELDLAVRLASAEGTPYDITFRIIIPGEEIKWAHTICRTERDARGNVVRLFGTVQDISELENTLQKLRTTELLLRSVLSNAPLTIFATDAEGVFTLSEGRELENVSLHPGENVGVSAYDLYNELTFTESSGNVITGKEVLDRVLSGETLVLTDELRGVYFDNHLGPIINENGEIRGMVGIAINITDQKRTESDLAKSELKFRNLFEKSVVPVWEEDFSEVKKYFDRLRTRGVRDFRKYFSRYPERAARCVSMVKIININQTSVRFFGVKEKSDLELNLDRFFNQGSFQCFVEEIIVLAEGKREYDCDIPVMIPEGTEKYVHLKLLVLPDATDSLSQVLVSWIDISDRLKYEEELKRSGDTLRQLNMHIEEAREKERSHIALNLHDDLGQKLTVLKMDLSWLRKRIGVQSALVSDKFNAVEEIIDTSIKTVQKISSELRPTILYDLGLREAVEWHLKHNLEPAGIKSSFRMSPSEMKIDEKTSIALFRIIQEAITNVIRHAGATRVNIRITASPSAINLIIQDDGRGIEAETVNNPKSFGIAGIKERVKAISGNFHITGIKDKGTKVSVKIPGNYVNLTDD